MNEEISNKHKLVRTLTFDLTSPKIDSKFNLRIIDFVNITTVFLTGNNNNILKFWNAQVRKLANYILIILTTIHIALKTFHLVFLTIY